MWAAMRRRALASPGRTTDTRGGTAAAPARLPPRAARTAAGRGRSSGPGGRAQPARYAFGFGPYYKVEQVERGELPELLADPYRRSRTS